VTASRTSRRTTGARTRRLVTAGLAAVLALSGCSAGQVTQTAEQVAPVPGIDIDAGDVALRNLVIEYDGPEGYPAGADAALIVRVFNNSNSPVTLVGVTADKAASVELVGTVDPVTTTEAPPPPSPSAPPSASAEPEGSPSPEATESPSPEPTEQPAGAPVSITIPPQSFVLLVPGQGEQGYLRLTGLTEAITPGESVAVTLTFSDGTSVTANVPLAPTGGVVPRATPIVEPGHAQPGH
jgi:copper(I)-binding protein